MDENIGYYEIIDDTNVKKSEIYDSALNHLIRIADYLESNLDYEDETNCLKILFGDWNDALDGLGHTSDEGKKYGTGVSVMASLHFYQNLFEITEILKSVGGYDEKIDHYLAVRDRLKCGIIENAIVENENGEKRLIHGWGDHMNYKVGSFCDSDNVSRISFAPNAFWVTSQLIRETAQLKPLIIETLHNLDSKYGLKTLTPAFTPSTPGVGRIAYTEVGTAENDCVYVHATMFSLLALFGLGDAEFAWEQFVKVLPISNEQITKTPFVMSNSYLDNPKQGLLGQSPIDWYTGSGTVVIKNLVRCVLGIDPTLNSLVIKTAKKMPSNVCADMIIKGYNIHFEYKNESIGSRIIYMDDEKLETVYDELSETQIATIPNDKLHNNAVICVVD